MKIQSAKIQSQDTQRCINEIQGAQALHSSSSTYYFKIDMVLWKETITIKLQDYIKWQKYNKQLKQEELLSINPRIQIEDIFQALKLQNHLGSESSSTQSQRLSNSQAKIDPIRGKTEKETKNGKLIFGYGDRIDNQCSSFMIQESGKIKVWTKIIHLRAAKSVQKTEFCQFKLDYEATMGGPEMFQIVERMLNNKSIKDYKAKIARLQKQSWLQKKKIAYLTQKHKKSSYPIKIILNNQIIEHKVHSNTAIRVLKIKLTKEYGINWNENRLIFQGQQVRTHNNMAEEGISYMSELTVVPRSNKERCRYFRKSVGEGSKENREESKDKQKDKEKN